MYLCHASNLGQGGSGFLEGSTSRVDNTHIHNTHIRNVVHAILPDIVQTLPFAGPSKPQRLPPRRRGRCNPAVVLLYAGRGVGGCSRLFVCPLHLLLAIGRVSNLTTGRSGRSAIPSVHCPPSWTARAARNSRSLPRSRSRSPPIRTPLGKCSGRDGYRCAMETGCPDQSAPALATLSRDQHARDTSAAWWGHIGRGRERARGPEGSVSVQTGTGFARKAPAHAPVIVLLLERGL
jgi:hypothetical protein